MRRDLPRPDNSPSLNDNFVLQASNVASSGRALLIFGHDTAISRDFTMAVSADDGSGRKSWRLFSCENTPEGKRSASSPLLGHASAALRHGAARHRRQ